VASSATTSASGGISYSAPAGKIASSPSNFSGSTPTLSAVTLIDTTPPPPPATTTSTTVTEALQQSSTVVNQLTTTPPPETSSSAPETGGSTLPESGSSSAPEGRSDATSPVNGEQKEGDKTEEEKKTTVTAATGEANGSGSDKPAESAPEGSVVHFIVGNSIIEKPETAIMQVNVPPTRTLVCR
jgi:hypothetical protein